MSSKDNDKESVIHSESDNIEITINGKGVEAIEELLQPLLFRYQIGLETSMKGSDFIFHCVHLTYYKYYKYHKVNFKRCGSYIDPPDWIKNVVDHI